MSTAVGASNEGEPDTARAPARKRRRRTVTTGASEDCFTCRKRQTPCDRVRPFCSQCLQLGKECSGYRTTLTWGVGVASRGKLRGMSLPVLADSDQQSNPSRPLDPKADQPSASELAGAHGTFFVTTEPSPSRKRKRSSVPSIDDTTQQIQPPAISKSWPLRVPQQEHIPGGLPSFSLKMEYEDSESSRLGSAGSRLSVSSNTLSPSNISTPYADWDQQSEYNPTSDPTPSIVDPFEHQRYLSNFPTPASHPASSRSRKLSPRPAAPTSGPVGSDMFFKSHPHAAPIPIDSPSTYSLFDEESNFPFNLTPHSQQGQLTSFDGGTILNDEDDEDDLSLSIISSSSPKLLQPLSDTPFHLQPRRLRYLLDFYNKAICPVLVAFDDHKNPYRDHILRLAGHSPGLQHAIAALVTNNMRMRSSEHVPWQQQGQERRALLTAPGNPSDEEQFHKTKSMELLNEQLRNVGQVPDDSVLATLLVLCLFHVCNSGFTKFKTQLAGVQKLLRMRNRSSRSDFIGWVEMFFTWFDVMTSAVNNRETEIHGDSLEMTDFTANLGALEHYSGCDGRLFKLIARLGRLNLLSQNRPVREATMQGPASSPGETAKPMTEEFQRLPGDSREAFWREWHDVRERLYAWTYIEDKAVEDISNMSLPYQHIVDISESFRWSALIYTERLAYPNLPSKSRNIQELVAQSMSHIEAIGVNSCVTKFLLWPLFVTGTECVEEHDRNMIRERCVEIQHESGFYNNISGLQVLERMWHEGDLNGPKLQAPNGQAFWWRTAMDKVDGEYIVI